MNPQKFVSGTLHSLWMDYFEEVLDLAGTVFEQSIVPFCDERGMSFSTGNGYWRVWTPEVYWTPNDHKDDEEWQEIATILTTTVKGLDYELGSLMPDYQPEDSDESS